MVATTAAEVADVSSANAPPSDDGRAANQANDARDVAELIDADADDTVAAQLEASRHRLRRALAAPSYASRASVRGGEHQN